MKRVKDRSNADKIHEGRIEKSMLIGKSRKSSNVSHRALGNEFTMKHLVHFYEQLPGKVARSILAALKSVNPIRALEIEIDPATYSNASKFARDYLAVSYIKKYPGFLPPVVSTLFVNQKGNCVRSSLSPDLTWENPQSIAMTKFEQSELGCKATNTRFRRDALPLSYGVNERGDDIEEILFVARKLISDLLAVDDETNESHSASVDPLIKTLQDACGWSSGSTFSIIGNEAKADVTNKVCEDPISVTSSALPHLRGVLANDYQWLKSNSYCNTLFKFSDVNWLSKPADISYYIGEIPDEKFRVVRGAMLATVPKNSKSDRTILVEPSGNIFLQKGVGAFIRTRLLRVGIDLRKQSVNQIAASNCKLDNTMTIDLSAASDSISVCLVQDLLPTNMFNYMDSLRSHQYVTAEAIDLYNRKLKTPGCKYDRFSVGDEAFKVLEKFSSMGNGFTFELESLIFWALTKSTIMMLNRVRTEWNLPLLSTSVKVYGDDIICDRDCYDSLIRCFDYCGFSINKEKSFSSGHFYESCGRHYFKGIDVTPLYLTRVISSDHDLMHAFNAIMRFSMRTSDLGRYRHDSRKNVNHFILRDYSRLAQFLRQSANNLELYDAFTSSFYDEDDNGFVKQASQIKESCIRMENSFENSVYNRKCKKTPLHLRGPQFDLFGNDVDTPPMPLEYGIGYYGLKQLLKRDKKREANHPRGLLAYRLRLRITEAFNGKVNTGRPPKHLVKTVYRWVGADILVI
jgi:hypothetical protein